MSGTNQNIRYQSTFDYAQYDVVKTSRVFDVLKIKGQTSIINSVTADLIVEGGSIFKQGVLIGDGGFKNHLTYSTNLSGVLSHEPNDSVGNEALIFINRDGNTINLLDTSHSIISNCLEFDGGICIGDKQQSFIAIGNATVNGSTDSSIGIGVNANANGGESIAIGLNAHSNGTNSQSFGRDANAVAAECIAIGRGPYASGSHSTAIGANANALGTNSQALGTYANALGNNSQAFGRYANAVAAESIAIGRGPVTSGSHSTAIGANANAQGINSQALGTYANAVAAESIAIGRGPFANGSHSTAIGANANAQGINSQAFGTHANALGTNSQSFGRYANAVAAESIAIGRGPFANGTHSIAIGSFAKSYGHNAYAIGSNASALGNNSQAFGLHANAVSESSIAIGHNACAIHTNSTAIGHSVTTNGIGETRFGGTYLQLPSTETPPETAELGGLWANTIDNSLYFRSDSAWNVIHSTGDNIYVNSIDTEDIFIQNFFVLDSTLCSFASDATTKINLDGNNNLKPLIWIHTVNANGLAYTLNVANPQTDGILVKFVILDELLNNVDINFKYANGITQNTITLNSSTTDGSVEAICANGLGVGDNVWRIVNLYTNP